MTVQHIIKRILVLVFLACLPVSVLLASSESYIQTLTGKIKKGDSCIVIDDKFLHLPLDEWNKINHLSVDNIITFELRFDTSVYFYNKPFTCTLNVSIKYYTSRDQTTPEEINNVDLVVKYDTAKGAFYPASAQHKFKNAFKVVVVVNSITSQEWGENIPAIFRLKNQILVERKYPFNPDATGPLQADLQNIDLGSGVNALSLMAAGFFTGITNNSNQLVVSWNPADFGNPEEYDIEWTFIDELSTNGQAILGTYANGGSVPKTKALEWMVNDNSRVTVTSSSYTINLPYPKGYVLVRVRGVSYQAVTNLRITGNWDNDNGSGFALCAPVTTAHESGMNWQYTAAFAEEGKRKEVITYYDATLRNRQGVTLSNSDKTLVPGSSTDRQETAIVQETIYDQMGRPAINVLPAPVNSKSLNYYQAFNVNSTGQPFSHTDINLAAGSGADCIIDADYMGNSSPDVTKGGASKYYSANNTFLNDNNFYFTKYVPDANKYPYSLVEYTPDNTGRVRRQGAPGDSFRIVNGHATQYIYGKPTQRELDRIFGMEAGDCSHYLKNMIIDPNGQASVTYFDANGRTVATALAGDAPQTVDALPSASGARVPFNDQIIGSADFRRDAAGMLMKSTTTFMAEVVGTFKLNYTVNPAALTTSHSQGQFCSNCYYDLVIEVKDDCGIPRGGATSQAFTINDVTCNPNAAPVTGNFDVIIPKKGSYTVTYTLRLSQNVVNYQTDYYIANNSDLKKLQNFFEEELNNLDLAGCYTTCEACKTLGTTPDAFRQKVIDLLGTDKFNGIQANSNVQTWINNTWSDLKAKCNNVPCNATSACEDYLLQMKYDVTPGGQYAIYTYDEQSDTYSDPDQVVNIFHFYNFNDASNTGIYNLTYVNDDGNTVYAHDLSMSDFIRVYIQHPEWADEFVKKHVEYCSYLFCKDQSYSPVDKNVEASYNFDKTLREFVANGDDAVGRGYYNRSNMYALLDADPFFNGGRGSSLKGNMQQDMNDFSNAIRFIVKDQSGTILSGKNIFAFIDWMLYCKPATNDANAFVSSWTSACSPSTTCRSVTSEWELYRNYYLQIKSSYVRKVKADLNPGCVDCFIGPDALGQYACTQNNTLSCLTTDDFEIVEENQPWPNDCIIAYWFVYLRAKKPVVTRTQIKLTKILNQVSSEQWVTVEPGTTQKYLDAGVIEKAGHEEFGCSNYRHDVSFYIINGQITCDLPIQIPSTCSADPRAASYAQKSRVFNDYTFVQGTINCLGANTSSVPTNAEVLNKYRTEALSNLEELRLVWADQLKAVRDEEPAFNSIADGTIDQLTLALKEIAKKNIETDTTFETIRAASTLPNGVTASNGFHNFEEAFNYYIGSSLVQQGFSQELLGTPYPWDKNPVTVNSNSGEINSTICANLAAIKSRFPGGDFYSWLKQELEDDMVLTGAQLQDLETRCASSCRYMNDPVLLPAALSTPASSGAQPYVNCSTINTLLSDFLLKYPGINQNSKLYRVLFSNYCNHKLGYALSYSDYFAFTQKCTVNGLAVLYNKPASPAVPQNDFICTANVIMAAFERAGQEYDRYITQERIRFRNLYIAKCIGANASASIAGEQYEYHYTLYYYDQSGNLVKTIPPEGVRFLSDAQIDQVKTLRSLGVSGCEDDGITKSDDKATFLNTFSGNLQSNAVQSLEMWLNNVDANAGSQIRLISPDNRFMYQAAIKGTKLWVELYSLQPGTSGDIEITLSNQIVADISSFTVQKWSQVVVQSTGFTGNTSWDIYFNGNKLAPITTNAPAYPFDWEIVGGYTLPAEFIEPLKHLRLYNRALADAEVAQNYANPCMSITESLKGTNSPLLVWGRFNIASLCSPATEIVTIPNRGALQLNAALNLGDKALPNVTNNFTVELWVNPQGTHEIDTESQSGITGISGQKYVIVPYWGGYASTGRAGMGLSVGTNGVSVYEHADGYLPPLLAWQGSVTGWTHIAVVYTNKTPSLYINGQLVRTGLTSTKTYVSPSYNFGGSTYGFMPGAIDEVRIWSVARTAQEILNNYQLGISPSAVTNLAGYWPIDPEDGTNIADVTCNHNNVQLPASGYSWANTGAAINNIVSVESLNKFIVPLHGISTTYAYNSLNQVIKQTSPDGGTSLFWYDRLGKLTVSQNAEQLQPLTPGETGNRYSYTKYDAFDRIVEIGEKVSAGSAMSELTARDNAALQTWMQSGQNSQITQTIYDEAPAYAPGLLTNLRKRIAASVVWDGSLGSQRAAATYYSYDISGNTKTLYQENQKLSAFDAVTGIKRIDYDYDLVSGKVNKVKYQEGKGDQFYDSYRYDADNRVVEASTSRDGLIWNTEANYRYYLHGPLARIELGNNKVQGLDYAYTLQGWLKGINGQQLDASKDMSQDGDPASAAFKWVARDVIGFSLGYFKGDFQPIGSSATAFGMTYLPSPLPNTATGNDLFNGNISNSTLAINKLDNGALKGYTYRYDQLNRLKQMRMHDLAGGGVTWNNNSILPAYQEDISYDGNGNILEYQRRANSSNGAVGYKMDMLTYNYNRNSNGQLINNKLRHVDDDAALTNLYNSDIDDQQDDHYLYDKIGNLIQEGTGLNASKIYWTLYGKIKQVEQFTNNIVSKRISYKYDATGNRIVKSVESPGVSTEHTFYVRDAQGNVLDVYTRYVPASGTDNNKLKWTEQHLYGSRRLGIWHPNIDVTSTWTAPGPGSGQINVGEREYELSNHLGNVLATISDSRTGIDVGNNGTIDYYEANVLTASDYYPFGMQMPGRIWNSGNYRYGFNGKENDNEIKGDGNQQDYGLRIYDPRIGKFLSVDPLTNDYPWYSPYQFAGNSPIANIDLDGAEPLQANGTVEGESKSETKEIYNAKGDWVGTNHQTLYWHAGGLTKRNGKVTNANWYSAQGYLSMLSNTEAATAFASDLGLSFDQPSQFARDELQKFVDRGLSLDGFKYFAAAANLQVDNIKSFRSGRADMSDINVDDLIGIGLLVKEGTKLLVNGIKSYGNSLAKDIGRKNIDWIRKQHVIGGKKNIALLGGEVEGQPIFGIGVSGATYREGMVGLPVFRNFAWRVIKHPRNYDSEIKLLEEFARRFHKTPNIKGRLGIISELPICESCSGVIRQFNKMFPNIEVYTINGVK